MCLYRDKFKKQLKRWTVVELEGKDGKDQSGAVSTLYSPHTRPRNDSFIGQMRNSGMPWKAITKKKKENTLRLKVQWWMTDGQNYKISHELY